MINKFSNLDKNKDTTKDNDNLKYKGDYLNVVSYKEYDIVEEPSMVIIVPYLRDEGYILLRHEFVPTYQYFYKDVDQYKDITHFLTCISGTVEKGEDIKNTVRRELYEEAGVVLSNLYDIEISKSLFLSKGNVAQYHICFMELRYNDYRVTQPKTDGSKEEAVSNTIQVSLGDLDELRTHDLITEYVLTKFRLDNNIK